MICSLGLRHRWLLVFLRKILATTPGAAASLHHPAHQDHDSDHHQETGDHDSGEKDYWHSKKWHHKGHVILISIDFF